MANRDDITVLWHLSPRLIFVDDPSVEVVVQDLHDTLRDLEDEPANMIYPRIISSAGKEELGGGVTVGITSTLENARLGFDARKAWVSTGTVDTTDTTGRLLIDSTATFQTDGVVPGSWIVNMTDRSICSVRIVDLQTQLTTDILGGGTDNQFDSGDVYRVMNVTQMDVSGGNLVALDAYGAELDPIIPTAGTQVVRTAASSATTQNQLQLEHTVFNGVVTVDITGSSIGTAFPIGTQQSPVSNMEDAISIANTRNFDTFFIVGDLTIDAGLDYTNRIFIGSSRTKTMLTITDAATVNNCEFMDAAITGILDGGSKITDCNISILDFVDGFIENCILSDTITLSGAGTAHFLNCFSGIPGSSTPTIDMGGSGSPLAIRGYNGGIKLINHTGTDDVSIDMSSGQVIIDSTVTAGTILVRGITKITDNSTGTTIVDSSDAVVPSRLTNIQFMIEALRPHHTGFGTVYYWDPINGNDTFDSLAPSRARKTAQSIIDDLVISNNHDIIVCLAETSSGSTIVDQTISINKAYTLIRGPGRDFILRPSSDPGSPTIEISAEGVEISGMRVEGFPGGDVYHTIDIIADGDFALLNNVWVTNSTDSGIGIASSNSIIDSCTVMDSDIFGIHLHNSTDDCTITNCIIKNNASGGINLDGYSGALVSDNVIIGDNVIHSNGGWAIQIDGYSHRTSIGSNISMWNNTLGNILDNGVNTGYSGDLGRELTKSAVWDGYIVDHIIPGTFGASNQGTVSVDAYQIADAVWTTQASGYFNNDGSMGQVLGFTLAVNATVNATVDGYTIQTTLNEPDNFWDNHQAVIYDISTGNRVVRNVTSYLQSSGTITFSEELPFTAVSGDLLIIITRTPATGTATATVDNNAIATAVWAKSISTSSAEGTFGRTVGFTTAAETTVTGGTATAITTGLTQANDFWNDHQVIVLDAGSGERVTRNVTTYTNAGGTITFNDPLPFTPAVSDTVLILSRSSSTTAAVSVDAYAVANAVWEETISSHLNILTFGGFLANQAGFGPLPPISSNISTGSSRSFSGSGNASIILDAPINYITVSVQKASARLSVDGGQTFINLTAGIHSFRIGITKIVKIQSTQTWQFIGEKA